MTPKHITFGQHKVNLVGYQNERKRHAAERGHVGGDMRKLEVGNGEWQYGDDLWYVCMKFSINKKKKLLTRNSRAFCQ